MNRFIRNALVLIICLSVVPTATRFFYYEYKFANLSNLTSSPIANLKNEESFPSSQALKVISNNPDARVLTFRQSDLISLDRRNWIDNFDPRATALFQAESEFELFSQLSDLKVKYVLVPNYTWPTIYNTKFAELLSNPRYSKPLIENVTLDFRSDNYQLFLIEMNNTSTSCVQAVVKSDGFLRERGGIFSRLLDALLGIPNSFQGSMQEIEISDLEKFENFGLNQSTLLRNLNGNPEWYHEVADELKSRWLIVRVKTKSNSLISLSVQGVSRRNEVRNLISVGRTVNVSESLSQDKITSLSGQFLTSSDVGSVRVFLRSFSGPKEISNPVQLQICQVRDSLGVLEAPLRKTQIALSNQFERLDINLRNCDQSGVCEFLDRNERFWTRLNLRARSALQGGYVLTQKIYGINERVDLKLKDIFTYSDSSLQPYSLKCVSNCPDSGLLSLEWTNPYGFRTSLILASSIEVKGAYAQIFAPNLSSDTEPRLILRKYSGVSTRKAIYEFWREDVTK